MKRIVVVLSVLILLIASNALVHAQKDVDALEQMKTKYFSSLEMYRNQEQTYFVAKGQFLQLKTLASQEVAVKETKSLLTMRADVFLNYLDVLAELLNRTTSVPVELKNPQLVSLGLVREKVLIHKNVLANLNDRLEVDQESLNFLPTISELKQESYYTLGLIRIGRTQTALDKAEFVKQQLKEQILTDDLSPTVKSVKERGFTEIERTQQDIETLMIPIRTEVKNKDVSSLPQLTRISQLLSPVYAQTNQLYQFLQEIRK